MYDLVKLLVSSSMITVTELIHTSYFDSASLRRLIAYTISECEGFAASHTFTAHQDYEMSKSLLEQVRVEAAGIKTEN